MQLMKATELIPHDSVMNMNGVSDFVVAITMIPGGCDIVWQSMATGERWEDCYSEHELLEVFRV